MVEVETTTQLNGRMIRKQLLNLETELNKLFIQRSAEIRGLMLATLSSQHILFLGTPGTGKSALVKKWSEALGLTVFDRLITEYTTPDETFGPVDLAGLERGVFRRIIKGKAADSQMIFLDEVFKGSSSILNTLLRLMQEREYDNDGVSVKTPLMNIIGASNELPEEGSGLEAFYDRFLLRYWVRPIEDDYSLREMLKTDISAPVSSITLDEIEFAQNEIILMRASKFGADSADSIVNMWSRLKYEMNIHPSDRRLLAMKSVMAADSWLNGNAVVMPESIGVAADILWNRVEDQGKVSQLALVSQNPYRAEANDIVSAGKTLVAELLRDSVVIDSDATSTLITLRDMENQLVLIERKATGQQKIPVEGAIGEVKELQSRVLRDGLGVSR